jgi:16S rRNA (guanine(966)-N(2))-methyltransferase RsmD
MSMRIIAGSARGHRLECPPGLDVRPAPEIARAALFNILCQEIIDAEALDLFAGVGSVGIEALSRGAACAVFVEINSRHRAFLEKNLQHARLADRAEVLAQDAFRAPEWCARTGRTFGLIYLGPPFPLYKNAADKAALLDLADRLAEGGALKPGGVLVLQSDERESLPEATRALCLDDRRIYGRNALAFYRRAGE